MTDKPKRRTARVDRGDRIMNSQSKVEFHPQRDKIIERIIAGHTAREIARDTEPKLSFMCISRYRSNTVRPELAKALLANNMAAAAACATRPDSSPKTRMQKKLTVEEVNQAQEIARAPIMSIFRQRLEALHVRVERVLDRAEQGNDLYPIPQLMNQAHKNLEMLGRATGELDKVSNNNLSIQIICPSSPSPDSVRISYSAPDAIEQPQTDCTEEIGLIDQ